MSEPEKIIVELTPEQIKLILVATNEHYPFDDDDEELKEYDKIESILKSSLENKLTFRKG